MLRDKMACKRDIVLKTSGRQNKNKGKFVRQM